MRLREEIERENRDEVGGITNFQVNPILLEVLLDIRDFQRSIKAEAKETNEHLKQIDETVMVIRGLM